MPFLKKGKENDDFLRNEGQQKILYWEESWPL